MKPGTIIICVVAKEGWNITVGYLYVVQKGAGGSVLIITDDDSRLWYNEERFKILIEP